MSYKVGEVYTFDVIDIRKNSAGDEYLAVKGIAPEDTTKVYRIYNLAKAQHDDVPFKVDAYVKSTDISGNLKLKQDMASLYKAYYTIGEPYPFKVTDIQTDFNSMSQYYVLEDDLDVYRYYTDKNQTHQIGDNCNLIIEDISDKGFPRFAEVKTGTKPASRPAANARQTENIQPIVHNTTSNILAVDGEGQNIELKASIVFPPQCNGIADIDRQLTTIVKELTSFMNADGGKLYIGITDDKRIVGIQGDYAHLNDGEDPFNGSYRQTADHYELKIRNAVQRLCTSIANESILFDFKEENGKTYCIIDVKKADRPVWMKETLLFQRIGNRIQQLRKDEITFFVIDRMKSSIGLSLSSDDLYEMVKKTINERRKAVAAPASLPNPDDVSYYLIWYNDGSWTKTKEKDVTSQNIFKQIAVTKDKEDNRLIFCYESGTINEVTMSDFKKNGHKKSIKLGEIRNSGFNSNEAPKEIFLSSPTNLIAVFSANAHGTEFVKVHKLTDFNTTERAFNQGPRIIPTDGHALSFKIIPAGNETQVKSLICKKAETTTNFGVEIESPILAQEIDFVKNI